MSLNFYLERVMEMKKLTLQKWLTIVAAYAFVIIIGGTFLVRSMRTNNPVRQTVQPIFGIIALLAEGFIVIWFIFTIINGIKGIVIFLGKLINRKRKD